MLALEETSTHMPYRCKDIIQVATQQTTKPNYAWHQHIKCTLEYSYHNATCTVINLYSEEHRGFALISMVNPSIYCYKHVHPDDSLSTSMKKVAPGRSNIKWVWPAATCIVLANQFYASCDPIPDFG